MARTIFLRIGTRDRIDLAAFIDSLRNFLSVLRDLDSTISRDPHGTIIWEVVSLQKSSPPVVGVAPNQKRGFDDFSEAVEGQFIENARMLLEQGERTSFMSDAALLRLETLAKRTPKLGSMAVYVNAEDAPKRETLITERTLENVQQLTKARYSAYGSTVGSLDAISVHRGNEFRVWDETTNKPVLCKFSERDLGHVKALLKSRVTVSGTINSNSAGNPISILIEEVVPNPIKALPTIEEMSGFVEDFTEGKGLKQYLKDLSDE